MEPEGYEAPAEEPLIDLEDLPTEETDTLRYLLGSDVEHVNKKGEVVRYGIPKALLPFYGPLLNKDFVLTNMSSDELNSVYYQIKSECLFIEDEIPDVLYKDYRTQILDMPFLLFARVVRSKTGFERKMQRTSRVEQERYSRDIAGIEEPKKKSWWKVF